MEDLAAKFHYWYNTGRLEVNYQHLLVLLQHLLALLQHLLDQELHLAVHH